MSFKEMIELRKKFDLTQSDTARILGIKNPFLVSQWETGFRSPTTLTRRYVRLLVELPANQAQAILKKLEAYGNDDA